MKLADIKNLPEAINQNALMRAAGFAPDVFRKRMNRNSPELTRAESAAFKKQINIISKQLRKAAGK